jgi:hypothetical protein
MALHWRVVVVSMSSASFLFARLFLVVVALKRPFRDLLIAPDCLGEALFPVLAALAQRQELPTTTPPHPFVDAPAFRVT